MFFQIAKKGDNHFLKYVATIILVVVGAVVGQIPLGLVMVASIASQDISQESLEELQETMDLSLLEIDPNLSLFLMLLTFIGALGMLWLGLAKIHDKPFLSVVTARPKLDWSRVFWAFGIWTLFTIILEIFAYWMNPGNYALQFNLSTFIPLILIALFILPLQTSFEEIMFRGYLMQGLGLLTKNRFFPLLMTSMVFGLLHYFNPEIEKFGLGLMMTYYISIGLFLGICTLMDDGLELALGVHAATNIYGATAVSFSGSALQTPTIFRVESLDATLMLVASIVSALIFIMMASRKYAWKRWEKIYGPIIEQDSIINEPVSDQTITNNQSDTNQ